VFDSVINYLDKFGPELLVIQFGFLVILSTLFLWLWFSNRRKYHNLKHAIPANIVKSYLDSIIQNSTALKSSLFRGGGLDVGGVPSVMPLSNLGGGDSLGLSGAPSTALLEEINQKKALIASLEAQLSSYVTSQRELEAKFNTAENKIKELEALLAQARNSGGGDEVLKSELKMVTKERDDLRDRLKEFEIISDDLANLKRLQQENDQLKRTISNLQGRPAETEASPVVDTDNILSEADLSNLLSESTPDAQGAGAESTGALEDFLGAEASLASAETTESADPAEAEMAAAMQEQKEVARPEQSKEKTPEDLLSEFEKMLG
jgi:cell division protein FtsB